MIVKEPDLTGKNLSNYKIIEKLGKGGMATVYKAHELSLNRIVALKVLSSKLSEDAEYIKRFQREAQAAAQLNHQNIVQIYAIGEEEGIHYFAMEHIKGKTLSDIKKDKGILDSAYSVNVIKQVAEALSEAHKAGLIHRDIKPSNIMIDSTGKAKVTDFGIAYVIEAKTKLTRDGSIIGTPEYLSPEQCEGKKVDGRSDIYSLGVTLYEILTGKTPYEADTPVSMLMKIVKGTFPPIGEVNPNVPEQLQKIVEKMMQTNPDNRYANADELIKALDELDSTILASKKEEPLADKEAKDITAQIESDYKVERKSKQMWIAAAVVAVIILLVAGAFAAKELFFTDKSEIQQVSSSPVSSETEQETGTSETDTPVVTQQDTTDPSSVSGEKTGDTESAIETEESQVQPESSNLTTEPDPTSVKNADESAKSSQEVSENDPVSSVVTVEPDSFEKPVADASSTKPVTNREVKKPAPPPNSLVVSFLGDEEKEDIITSFVQSAFSRFNFQNIDGYSAGNKELSEVASYHIVVSVKHMGTSTLQYYGQTSEQYTVGLTIKGIATKNGRIVAGPVTKIVKYTAMNLEDNLKEAVDELVSQTAGQLNN
jgi:serine/threonine-protein kinase